MPALPVECYNLSYVDKTIPLVLLFEEDSDCAEAFSRIRFDCPENMELDVLIPPIRSMAYFSVNTSEELNKWWEKQELSEKTPRYLLEHKPNLGKLIKNIDGRIDIWCKPDDTRIDYDDLDNVYLTHANTLVEFLHSIGLVSEDDQEDDTDGDDEDDIDEEDDLNDEDAADEIRKMLMARQREQRMVGKRRGEFSDDGNDWRNSGDLEEDDDEDDEGHKKVERVAFLEPEEPSPFSYLAVLQPINVEAARMEMPMQEVGDDIFEKLNFEEDNSVAQTVKAAYDPKTTQKVGKVASGSKRWRGLRIPFLGGRTNVNVPDLLSLRGTIIKNKPIVISLGSVKGGPGKTTTAAGIAVVAGKACDLAGGSTGLVDGNLANPDAWNAFGIPASAPRIKTLCENLTNQKLPPPDTLLRSDRTPGLIVYPEVRESVEYGEEDIEILHKYFTNKHLITIVDLTNRLPSMTTSPEAAVAEYWIRRSSILILPMRVHPTDMDGVLQYLDVPDLPPVVVTYLSPRNKKTLERSAVKSFFATITPRVAAIIEVPDDPKVEQASFEGQNVEEVSPELGVAYLGILSQSLSIIDKRRLATRQF